MLTNISKHIHQFREIFPLTNPFLCVWERDGTHLATWLMQDAVSQQSALSPLETTDQWSSPTLCPVTTGAAQHYCHQLPVYKRIHTLQKLKYSIFYFLHIPKVPCPQYWLVQFVMSNRCFLSSSTLRLYLLIFWSAVEQCRGLEKCCPLDNGGQRLLCLQSDIICEVFSGTSCCTLAPHCHRDLHPRYQHHTPPPALINTDLLDSFSATLQVQVIWNTRWRLWRDGEKLSCTGGSLLTFAPFPPIFPSCFDTLMSLHSRI